MYNDVTKSSRKKTERQPSGIRLADLTMGFISADLPLSPNAGPQLTPNCFYQRRLVGRICFFLLCCVFRRWKRQAAQFPSVVLLFKYGWLLSSSLDRSSRSTRSNWTQTAIWTTSTTTMMMRNIQLSCYWFPHKNPHNHKRKHHNKSNDFVSGFLITTRNRSLVSIVYTTS